MPTNELIEHFIPMTEGKLNEMLGKVRRAPEDEGKFIRFFGGTYRENKTAPIPIEVVSSIIEQPKSNLIKLDHKPGEIVTEGKKKYLIQNDLSWKRID